MSQVTVDMITALHKEKDTLKSTIEQAKGRLSAIDGQLQSQVDLLARYGVTPETAEQKIKELDDSITDNYNKAKAILEELKDDKRG